jgi:hypothetical protein
MDGQRARYVPNAGRSRCLSGRVVDQFSTLCTVRADTTKLAKSVSPKRSAEGSLYYALEIKVILLFGLTELTAQVSWMENVSIPMNLGDY